jgi:hydrogenase maturation factor HypF (carbamoyltransferase family)
VIDLQPSLPVALCGGCFQNRLLTEAVVAAPERNSRMAATPGRIPTGDGGLAAGQLAIALAPEQQPDEDRVDEPGSRSDRPLAV